MQKLVIFAALLVLAAAAPQYPIFPFYNPFVYPYAQPHAHFFRSPFGTTPADTYPFPYYPGPFPYASSYAPPQQSAPALHVPAHTVPAHSTPAQSTPPADPGQQKYSSEMGDDLAKLILTPEQQALLEAAVAAMNPLEYAAQLDTLQQQQQQQQQQQRMQH